MAYSKKKRDAITYEMHFLELANLWILKNLEDQEKAEKQYSSSELFLRLHNDRKISGITLVDLEDFLELTDSLYPDFRYSVTNWLKLKSQEDIYICYLLKAKVKKAHIAKMLNLSRQAINNRCKKLSVGVFGLDCSPGVLEQILISM